MIGPGGALPWYQCECRSTQALSVLGKLSVDFSTSKMRIFLKICLFFWCEIDDFFEKLAKILIKKLDKKKNPGTIAATDNLHFGPN